LSNADLPETVYKIDAAPHEWLFPRMAALVHHGGAGTTAAGLRAGVPAQVIPFFGDQPFWAERVYQLGCGPRPIPRGRLNAEWLAAHLIEMVGDAAMRQRAVDLGAQIQAEDGVGRAIAALQTWFGGPR
jgi:UDP:flavonoid glycosyltransferase YjiC (YdhE family)